MSEPAKNRDLHIALLAIVCILAHVYLRFWSKIASAQEYPLYLALVLGGIPLVLELVRKLFRREFGSDLLAGISIVTGILLGEYLAATLVVLMLSGGEAIEAYAVGKASSVLDALAKRMPTRVHLVLNDTLKEQDLSEVVIGDVLDIFPHDIVPVDGTVLEGHSVVDESYLTGEPYLRSKTPGASVLSGSINGESNLRIRADKPAHDSRYARIMEVMKESEQRRPKLRRLGDTLGAWYTPLAVSIALLAWYYSGEAIRFLAVLVVATPCPLLIAIPTAIVGAISLAAKRGIIIRDPAILEQLGVCKTIILDKTGTLTFGKPKLVHEHLMGNLPGSLNKDEILALVASIERYSKHPLAEAVNEAAESRGLTLKPASAISEKPGEGLQGTVEDKSITITSRKKVLANNPELASELPEESPGLECCVLIDGIYTACYQFRDEPKPDGREFVQHLAPKHGFSKIMLVSGDRESEVSYLASQVGIDHVFAGQSPEEKLEIVRKERAKAATIFIGDGINDAPALSEATAGIALGQNSDITSEAADAVILDSSLRRVDDFFHIATRMRSIALQSALGGMALSIIGMGFASAGYLPPVAGALAQELIDVLAVLNALRVAVMPRNLSDFD